MKITKLPLFATAALAAGAFLLLAPSAWAAADTKSQLNSADGKFVQEEAAAGAALVRLAELAVKQAERKGAAEALNRDPPSAAVAPNPSPDRGLFRAVFDPYVNAVHVCLLRERPGHSEEIRHYFDEVRERLLHDGPEKLKAQEKLALFSDAESMAWLHTELWRRPPERLAPWWREALRTSTDRARVSVST